MRAGSIARRRDFTPLGGTKGGVDPPYHASGRRPGGGNPAPSSLENSVMAVRRGTRSAGRMFVMTARLTPADLVPLP